MRHYLVTTAVQCSKKIHNYSTLCIDFMETMFIKSATNVYLDKLDNEKSDRQYYFMTPFKFLQTRIPLLSDLIDRKFLYFYPVCQKNGEHHFIPKKYLTEKFDEELERDHALFLTKTQSFVSRKNLIIDKF